MKNFVDELPKIPQEKAKRIIKKILEDKTIDFFSLKLNYAIVVDKNENLVGLFLSGARLWKFDFLKKYNELYLLCWTKENKYFKLEKN